MIAYRDTGRTTHLTDVKDAAPCWAVCVTALLQDGQVVDLPRRLRQLRDQSRIIGSVLGHDWPIHEDR
ncbi:hypothetical protein [Actinopolymorpha pittospori]|uniref:hypothetical protein n=1 Tax=Actinopolymorpha pittospori TaxID=648752 RepID=UPI0031EEF9F4